MAQAPVLFEQRDQVGLITLNRPERRNCMSPELLDAFAGAIAAVRALPELRCLVITGAGTAFSAGADLKLQVQRDDGGRDLQPFERSFAMYEPFLELLSVEVPVVGALNGHAVGGGFGLALLCDMRVCSLTGRYGANFARIGLHPGLAISWLLPRLVGVSQAAELLFTGRLFDGAEAARMGLVSSAVPADEVLDTAIALAEEVAANAPIAVRMTKRTFYEGLDWEPRQAAMREAFAQAVTIGTRDATEGIAALLEKRTPKFEDR